MYSLNENEKNIWYLINTLRIAILTYFEDVKENLLDEKLLMKNIWIVEDDPGCRFVYEESLKEMFNIRQFENTKTFRDALSSERQNPPNLVIADLNLPGESFITFLKNILW